MRADNDAGQKMCQRVSPLKIRNDGFHPRDKVCGCGWFHIGLNGGVIPQCCLRTHGMCKTCISGAFKLRGGEQADEAVNHSLS